MMTFVTIVVTAVITSTATLFVERWRKADEKVEHREQVAGKLLRALMDCEAYVNGGPGMPVESCVWEHQTAVRDAALEYAEASRAVRRTVLRRRPSRPAMAAIHHAALATAEASWDNFDHVGIGALAKDAIAALVAEHPDLAPAADTVAVRNRVLGRAEPKALPAAGKRSRR